MDTALRSDNSSLTPTVTFNTPNAPNYVNLENLDWTKYPSHSSEHYIKGSENALGECSDSPPDIQRSDILKEFVKSLSLGNNALNLINSQGIDNTLQLIQLADYINQKKPSLPMMPTNLSPVTCRYTDIAGYPLNNVPSVAKESSTCQQNIDFLLPSDNSYYSQGCLTSDDSNYSQGRVTNHQEELHKLQSFNYSCSVSPITTTENEHYVQHPINARAHHHEADLKNMIKSESVSSNSSYCVDACTASLTDNFQKDEIGNVEVLKLESHASPEISNSNNFRTFHAPSDAEYGTSSQVHPATLNDLPAASCVGQTVMSEVSQTSHSNKKSMKALCIPRWLKPTIVQGGLRRPATLDLGLTGSSAVPSSGLTGSSAVPSSCLLRTRQREVSSKEEKNGEQVTVAAGDTDSCGVLLTSFENPTQAEKFELISNFNERKCSDNSNLYSNCISFSQTATSCSLMNSSENLEQQRGIYESKGFWDDSGRQGDDGTSSSHYFQSFVGVPKTKSDESQVNFLPVSCAELQHIVASGTHSPELVRSDSKSKQRDVKDFVESLSLERAANTGNFCADWELFLHSGDMQNFRPVTSDANSNSILERKSFGAQPVLVKDDTMKGTEASHVKVDRNEVTEFREDPSVQFVTNVEQVSCKLNECQNLKVLSSSEHIKEEAQTVLTESPAADTCEHSELGGKLQSPEQEEDLYPIGTLNIKESVDKESKKAYDNSKNSSLRGEVEALMKELTFLNMKLQLKKQHFRCMQDDTGFDFHGFEVLKSEIVQLKKICREKKDQINDHARSLSSEEYFSLFDWLTPNRNVSSSLIHNEMSAKTACAQRTPDSISPDNGGRSNITSPDTGSSSVLSSTSLHNQGKTFTSSHSNRSSTSSTPSYYQSAESCLLSSDHCNADDVCFIDFDKTVDAHEYPTTTGCTSLKDHNSSSITLTDSTVNDTMALSQKTIVSARICDKNVGNVDSFCGVNSDSSSGSNVAAGKCDHRITACELPLPVCAADTHSSKVSQGSFTQQKASPFSRKGSDRSPNGRVVTECPFPESEGRGSLMAKLPLPQPSGFLELPESRSQCVTRKNRAYVEPLSNIQDNRAVLNPLVNINSFQSQVGHPHMQYGYPYPTNYFPSYVPPVNVFPRLMNSLPVDQMKNMLTPVNYNGSMHGATSDFHNNSNVRHLFLSPYHYYNEFPSYRHTSL